MRRGLTVGLVLGLVAVLVLAPVASADSVARNTSVSANNVAADGSSVADVTGDGINDIVYLDGGTIHYRNLNAETTTNTGVSADQIAVGDVTDDGRADVVFVDSSNNLKYRDIAAGSTTDTGEQADSFIFTTGDPDGDDTTEIVFGDPSTGGAPDLKSRDVAAGSTTDYGFSIFPSAIAAADQDQNGGSAIAYQQTGSLDMVVYVPGSGNFSSGQTGLEPSFGDIDGDGSANDVAFRDTNDNVYVFAPVQGTRTASVDATRLTTGDADADGTDEIVADQPSGTVAIFDEADGTTTDTGESLGGTNKPGAGDVTTDGRADIVGTGSGTLTILDQAAEPPTVTNATPNQTTVSSDPVTLSADINDSNFDGRDSVTVEFAVDGRTVNTQTVSSNQTVSYDWQPNESVTQWSVTATDQDGRSDTATQSITVDVPDPVLSNVKPADGATVERNQQLSAQVNDSQFATSNNEQVTVEFLIDGSVVGTETLTANGTASTTWSAAVAGDHQYEVRATDAFEATDSVGARTLKTPAALTLRNESNASQLIATSANVTVRFFGSEGTVESRSTTSGRVNMTGLPADETFVAEVSNVGGYRDRRVVIESLFEQQSVYLLNSSVAKYDVEFELNDNTGQFPASETVLVVSKPISRNGTTAYRNLAGDRFGASNTLPFDIRQGERVRLELRNEDGDVRKLGSFTVSRDTAVPLEVGSLEFPIADEDTYSANATRNDQGSNSAELVFEYTDPANATDEVRLRIVNVDNTSQVLTTDNVTGPVGTYRFSTQVSGAEYNESWVAVWEADRGGETVSSRAQFGAERYPVNTGLDEGWRQIFGVGFIIVTGGLFSVANARIGAVVLPGAAAALWYIGWMSGVASAGAIVVALSLGVGYNLAVSRGVPA